MGRFLLSQMPRNVVPNQDLLVLRDAEASIQGASRFLARDAGEGKASVMAGKRLGRNQRLVLQRLSGHQFRERVAEQERVSSVVEPPFKFVKVGVEMLF